MMKRAILFIGLMMIVALLFCGMSYAEGGNYEGIDWDLTDGVLTLGNGDTQTLLNNTDRIQTDWPWWDSRQSITSVVCNGRVILNGSLRGMFMSCENATSIDVSGFNTSGVTNMIWLFDGCKKVASLSVNHFDMQNVTSIQGMFEQCTKLESIDVSNWNTLNIENMSRVFYYCNNLVSITGISSWDTSSVTEMNELFCSCGKLTSLDLSSWDTSHVFNSSGMFSGCYSLTSLNVSTWVTSLFSSLRSMFSNCSSLTTLDVSGWDVSGVSDMGLLFSNCKKLESLDLSGWRTNSVTYMAQMFDGCEALTTIGDVSQWDVSRVTTMSSLFNKCKALQSIDVSSWDTGRVTSMSSLFCECSSLRELAVSNWNTAYVTYMAYMFRECSGLTSLDLSRWDTSHVTSMSHMFWNCYGLTELNVSGWNTGAVTNMDGMFYYCKNVDTLDVAGFDTSSVTNMKDMFSSCESVTELNVTRWDTSEVTNMSSMFARCHSITSLDLSNWNVSKVLYMGVYGSNSIGGGMFSHCVSLESINMSGWETDSLTSTQAMFAECTSLKVLDVSHLNMTNVDKCQSMFAQSGIVNIDVSMWNLSQSTNLYRMFAMCKDLQLANVAYLVRSGVTCVCEMFWHCDHLLSLDLSTWDTSTVTDMRDLFYNDHELKSLNISSWDTSSVTSMAGMYYTNRLSEVELGLHNPFKGAGNTSITLPKPPTSTTYTGKWIREDRTFGPYTPEELRDNYTSAMAGKWVWEKAPTDYTLSFVCTEDGYVGEMPQVTVLAAEDYELPGNAFFVFGKDFDHWTDGTRRIYSDREVIPANTYEVNAEVTLTAVFESRDRSINMQGGAFDFTLRADEKALFIPVPASISYQVYEQTPFGWNLIKQVGNAGVIEPDEESESLFLNKYDPLKVIIRFAGTKLMDESAADPDSFNFLLYEDETLIDIASVSEGGAIEFQPIEYDIAGNHHYYIKEAIGSDNTVEYDTHVEEITVSITSDGVGHLSADVTMDEDEILFKNESKPGMLALRKLNATTEDRDGVFYYEVQFTSENGQPYDLLSSDISYEEREGNVSEFPETQPLPEKPKYKLTVQHYTRDANLVESLYSTQDSYYTAGEIVSINAVTDGALGDYRIKDVDQGVVRVSDGHYKLLMPASDITVKAVYIPVTAKQFAVIWGGTDDSGPVATVNLFANDEYVGSLSAYRKSLSHGTKTYVRFTELPVYDDEGNIIVYTCHLDVIPEKYYLFQEGNEGVQINAGFQVHAFWDDNDDYYGLRPDQFGFDLSNSGGYGWLCTIQAAKDWVYSWTYGGSTTSNEYTYTITGMTNPYWKALGYTMVTSATDPMLDEFDVRLELTSVPIKGTIIWDDDNNGTGSRPSSVIVKAMDGETVVDSTRVYSSDSWKFDFELPLPGEWAPINYSLSVADVDGYKATIEGTTITMTKIRTADIVISDVTLLSKDEYEACADVIRDHCTDLQDWWLRSPVPGSSNTFSAYYVNWQRNAAPRGVYNEGPVRPAIICDMSDTDLQVGDKVSIAGCTWVVISDSIILCDEIVGESKYRDTSVPGSDYNNWELSDVKAWVENWAITNNIMPEPEFTITEVTLLSEGEYTAYKSNIPVNSESWWWLRSPHATYVNNAMCVASMNLLDYHGVQAYGSVRPALMCDLSGTDLLIGDQITLAGYSWTVIANDVILCDDFVGTSLFRADSDASNANDYDASDIKIWLSNWVEAHPFWTKTVTVNVIQ